MKTNTFTSTLLAGILTISALLTACGAPPSSAPAAASSADASSAPAAADSAPASEASSAAADSAPASEASSAAADSAPALDSSSAPASSTDMEDGLLIYSNSVSDGRGDWIQERAAKEGFTITFVDAGGGEIASRIMAEKDNPAADVVFGLNTMNYENFKSVDLLEQYVPDWASEVTEGLNDPDGYYHALVKQAVLLVYDQNHTSPENAVTDWEDLWKNEANWGKYEVSAGLGSGTVRSVIAGILTRYADSNGTLGVSDAGWESIGLYFQKGVPAVEGEDLYSKLATGQILYGQMWSSGMAAREKEYGVKSGIVNPPIGVPYTVEQIAIVKGTDKLEEAKRFVNWLGSAQLQREWALEFSTIPANEGAADALSEANKAIVANYKPQEIDWELVAANMDGWVEKIEQEYLQK